MSPIGASGRQRVPSEEAQPDEDATQGEETPVPRPSSECLGEDAQERSPGAEDLDPQRLAIVACAGAADDSVLVCELTYSDGGDMPASLVAVPTRFTCSVCSLTFSPEEVTNAGSKRWPSYRCKVHHAAVKRLDSAASTPEERRALKKLKRNKALYNKHIIMDAEEHKRGETQRGANRRFIQRLSKTLKSSECDKIKWFDRDGFVAYQRFKRNKNEAEAEAMWTTAVDNPDSLRREIKGVMHIGVDAGKVSVEERCTELERGVEEAAHRIDDPQKAHMANLRMDKLLSMSIGCDTFKGSGGEFFAPGGPSGLAAVEAKRPREEDDDIQNFAKQPRLTDEDGVRCKSVMLEKAELCEFIEGLDCRTSLLVKKTTHLVKSGNYSKAVESGKKFSTSCDVIMQKCQELIVKIRQASNLVADSIDEVARLIPERRTAAQVLEQDIILAEQNFKHLHDEVVTMRKDHLVAQRMQAKQKEETMISEVTSRLPAEVPKLVGRDWAMCLTAQRQPTSCVPDKLDEGRLMSVPFVFPQAVTTLNLAKLLLADNRANLLAKQTSALDKIKAKVTSAPPSVVSFESEPIENWMPEWVSRLRPVGLGSFARPWSILQAERRFVGPKYLPPFNGCGGFLGGCAAALCVVMVHWDQLEIVKYDMLRFLEQADSKRYKNIAGQERGLFVAYVAEGSWLWIPPGYQFAVGSLDSSVSQFIWQPILLQKQLQKLKNAHLMFVRVQVKAARGDMPSHWKHLDRFCLADVGLEIESSDSQASDRA